MHTITLNGFKPAISCQLPTEVEVLGQHVDDARDLLDEFLWIGGGPLEVQRHLIVDPRHDVHQLLVAVFFQHLAQRLHEP